MLAKKKKERDTSTKVIIQNTPYLIIVESPSKCPKIEKFLGFQYKCIASKGHIRELVKVGSAKQLYTPTYEPIQEKLSHMSFMKTIVSQFPPENIFLGTDDDREGEAIAWHICEVCDLPPGMIKRILFHEVTQPALKRAISNPIHIRMNIVHAQQARQVLDRMIGFKISPILSRLVVHESAKYLSAGRCQTPTLRLVYDRNQESASKETVQYHKVKGTFFQEPTTILANLQTPFPTEESLVDFLEKSKTYSHIFHLKEKKEKHLNPPKPFNTSALLQNASSYLSISPKRVMECCQTLYQEGYITYMRTDSTHYSKEFLTQMKEFLISKYGESFVGDFRTIEHANDQNPHEAIRATNVGIYQVDHEDKKVSDVYQLIWKRTVESCMSAYVYYDHGIEIEAPMDSMYHGSVEEPIRWGWKRVSSPSSTVDTKANSNTAAAAIHQQLQYLNHYQNKAVPFRKIESSLHVQNMEKHYNEAGLIQTLEQLGIGRPSTYSMLIDTIQERKYVKKQDIEGTTYKFNEYSLMYPNEMNSKSITKRFGDAKNKLCIQPIGEQSIQVLYEHFPALFDYAYTRDMETQLDYLVEHPEVPWYTVVQQCDKVIQTCLKPMTNKMRKVYSIDDQHELLFGKNGAVIRMKDTKQYKSVNPKYEIDFGKLERGEIPLGELLELPTDCLGTYQNESLHIKKGPYGAYVSWGDKKASIEKLVNSKTPLTSITLEMVVNYLEKKEGQSNSSILRVYDQTMSLRKGKGKRGNYLFYKTDAMSEPTFLNIRKCPYDVLNDEPDLIIGWAQDNILGKK
jgi:DNA topoisomerase-1